MQYSSVNTQEELFKTFPKFKPYWKDNEVIWGGDGEEPATLWGIMSVFSHYVAETLPQIQGDEKRKIFDFIEGLLENGDEHVDNAVCTCFLENLVNRTPEILSPESYAPYLGRKSLKFCKDWGLKI